MKKIPIDYKIVQLKQNLTLILLNGGEDYELILYTSDYDKLKKT